MRQTNQSSNNTSFHGHTVLATMDQLVKVCGEPQYDGSGDDKVQYEWDMETEDGRVFTIYDWKEYRYFRNDEVIKWHIGAHDGYTAACGQSELEEAIAGLDC